MITIDDLETSKGRNQIGTVKRTGNTCWGFSFKFFSKFVANV